MGDKIHVRPGLVRQRANLCDESGPGGANGCIGPPAARRKRAGPAAKWVNGTPGTGSRSQRPRTGTGTPGRTAAHREREIAEKNGCLPHKIRKNGVRGLYFAGKILYTKTNTVLTPIRKVRLYDYD